MARRRGPCMLRRVSHAMCLVCWCILLLHTSLIIQPSQAQYGAHPPLLMPSSSSSTAIDELAQLPSTTASSDDGSPPTSLTSSSTPTTIPPSSSSATWYQMTPISNTLEPHPPPPASSEANNSTNSSSSESAPISIMGTPIIAFKHNITTLRALWFQWAPCDTFAMLGPQYPMPDGQILDFSIDCVSLDEWHDRTFEALRSEDPEYDLLVLDSQWIGEAVENGYLANLTAELLNTSVRFEDYYPTALSSYSEYPKNSGDYYGMPLQGDTVFIAYRSDLFRENGQTPPRDLACFRDLAAFYTDHPNTTYGLSAMWCGTTKANGGDCYDQTAILYTTFSGMYGGDIWNEDTFQIEGVLDSQQNVAALDYLRELYQYGSKNSEHSYQGAIDEFCAGKSAMVLVWMGLSQSFSNCSVLQPSQIGYAAVPYNSQTNIHQLALGGQGLHVHGKSRNLDLAKKFAVWLTSYEEQLTWAQADGFTVRQSVAYSPSFLATPDGYAKMINAVYMQSYPLTKDLWRVAVYSDLLNIMMNYLNQALIGNISSSHALSQIARQQQPILDARYPCGEVACYHIKSSTLEQKILIAVLCFFILIYLVLFFIIYLTRKNRIIYAASPKMLYIVFTGNILTLVGAIFNLLPPDQVNCSTNFGILNVGFTMGISAILLKTLRLHIIFYSRSFLTTRKVNGYILASLLAGLIAWDLLLTLLKLNIVPYTNTPTAQGCQLDSKISEFHEDFSATLIILMIITKSLIVAISGILCIRLRKLPNNFNESTYLAIIIYNLAILGSLWVLIRYAFHFDSPVSLSIFESILVLIGSVITVGLIMAPKFVQVCLEWRRMKKLRQKLENEQMTQVCRTQQQQRRGLHQPNLPQMHEQQQQQLTPRHTHTPSNYHQQHSPADAAHIDTPAPNLDDIERAASVNHHLTVPPADNTKHAKQVAAVAAVNAAVNNRLTAVPQAEGDHNNNDDDGNGNNDSAVSFTMELPHSQDSRRNSSSKNIILTSPAVLAFVTAILDALHDRLASTYSDCTILQDELSTKRHEINETQSSIEQLESDREYLERYGTQMQLHQFADFVRRHTKLLEKRPTPLVVQRKPTTRQQQQQSASQRRLTDGIPQQRRRPTHSSNALSSGDRYSDYLSSDEEDYNQHDIPSGVLNAPRLGPAMSPLEVAERKIREQQLQLQQQQQVQHQFLQQQLQHMHDIEHGITRAAYFQSGAGFTPQQYAEMQASHAQVMQQHQMQLEQQYQQQILHQQLQMQQLQQQQQQALLQQQHLQQQQPQQQQQSQRDYHHRHPHDYDSSSVTHVKVMPSTPVIRPMNHPAVMSMSYAAPSVTLMMPRTMSSTDAPFLSSSPPLSLPTTTSPTPTTAICAVPTPTLASSSTTPTTVSSPPSAWHRLGSHNFSPHHAHALRQLHHQQHSHSSALQDAAMLQQHEDGVMLDTIQSIGGDGNSSLDISNISPVAQARRIPPSLVVEDPAESSSSDSVEKESTTTTATEVTTEATEVNALTTTSTPASV